MGNLNGHEAGNGGYGQGGPKATTPLLYSTRVNPDVLDAASIAPFQFSKIIISLV